MMVVGKDVVAGVRIMDSREVCVIGARAVEEPLLVGVGVHPLLEPHPRARPDDGLIDVLEPACLSPHVKVVTRVIRDVVETSSWVLPGPRIQFVYVFPVSAIPTHDGAA